MRVKIIKAKYKTVWYSDRISQEFIVSEVGDKFEVLGTLDFIHKEDCEIITESNHIAKKINSEYHFTRILENTSIPIFIILYIDYEKKTYDFAQNNEEGIMPKDNNECTEINKAYLELGLEVLKFVQSELYE